MTEQHSFSINDIAPLLDLDLPAAMKDRHFRGVSTLESAEPDEISFVFREKLRSAAEKSQAGLIIVSPGMELNHPNAVVVPHVMDIVLKLLHFFYPDPEPVAFVHPSAIVAETAKLGERVYIGPFCVIEDDVVIDDDTRLESHCVVGHGTTIGKGCWFSPRVTVMHQSTIGSRIRCHPGVVIGADGFRLELIAGRLRKVPQIGRVVIEDDVEIGANTTIDRASFTETRIGARTKIDNLVHVGHNVTIGSDCVIVAQVGIGGSTKIGRGVMIGGQSGIKDNIIISDGAKIGGRSGIQSFVAPGAELIGHPAVPIKEYARYSVFMRNFSANWSRIKATIKLVEAEDAKEDAT